MKLDVNNLRKGWVDTEIVGDFENIGELREVPTINFYTEEGSLLAAIPSDMNDVFKYLWMTYWSFKK
jgi:hypothetical protein